MPKIGIITLTGYFNYGNILQNYALQTFLNKLSKEQIVTTIWFKNTNLKISKRVLLNIKKTFNINGFGSFINKLIHFQKAVRDYNFKNFHNKYINFVYEKTKTELNDKYDYFVVGSDQVWNPYWLNDLTEFLQFADRNKRISYAASFGVSEINSEKVELVRKGLEGIDFISVREQAGAKIVKDLTGKDAQVVIDPTLLLTDKDWEEIMECPAWYYDEKYILVYFLGVLPDKIKSDIRILSEKYKLKIIDLMDKENIEYYTSSPGEFLYLIKNCSIMYTDSFHGTVFSILNRKPFVTCSKVSSMNMDSRIDTLLSMFNAY